MPSKAKDNTSDEYFANLHEIAEQAYHDGVHWSLNTEVSLVTTLYSIYATCLTNKIKSNMIGCARDIDFNDAEMGTLRNTALKVIGEKNGFSSSMNNACVTTFFNGIVEGLHFHNQAKRSAMRQADGIVKRQKRDREKETSKRKLSTDVNEID